MSSEKKIVPLKDEDVMTFGKFKGRKLKDVPAWYLDKCRDWDNIPEGLRAYIIANDELINRELLDDGLI